MHCSKPIAIFLVTFLTPFSVCSGFVSVKVSPWGMRSSSLSYRNDVHVESFPTSTREKTLYEILDCSPIATREEVRKRYIQLAKCSHPDACIGAVLSHQERPDFGEVASAWKVLGDSKTRKKYDRALRAKRLLAKWENILDEAAPVVASAVNDIAIPVLRNIGRLSKRLRKNKLLGQ